MSRPKTEDRRASRLSVGAGVRSKPLVALTGGMGAGKSTALKALAGMGAATLSTDEVVHELYEGEEMRDAVVGRWGARVAPGGVVDRGKVAESAFASDEDRRWLEQTLWPLVGKRVAEWLEEVRGREPAPRAVVIEVPLLFEAGMEGAYDATIAVIADEQVRGERAAKRGHKLEEARVGRQMSQDEKAKKATFVVRNDGSEEELAAQLSGVIAKLER